MTILCENQLPDTKLLEESCFDGTKVTPELRKTAKDMEKHFAEYGITAKVSGINPGPIVTLYEVEPAAGQRLADMIEAVPDITRALAASNLRIEPMPRTNLVGVEISNNMRPMIRFRNLVENPKFTDSSYRIPLALGVDTSGDPHYFDLTKLPHILVAGHGGSGVSVFLQSVITSIVYRFTPDKCRLMLINTKGTDFEPWDDIPNLAAPVIQQNPAAAVDALKWLISETEYRYKQLQLLNARNIDGYNEIVAQKRASGGAELSDMPYLVVIIDEFANMMNAAAKDVEDCILRIGQKAALVGIHLIMATQRPDTATITRIIKDAFPTRVSFKARSAADSMTTLGDKGAENLLPYGDILFSNAGRIPMRLHTAYIDEDEITHIADYLRSQGKPEYFVQAAPATDTTGNSTHKLSISYIQRKLGVGYNAASGLMDVLRRADITTRKAFDAQLGIHTVRDE